MSQVKQLKRFQTYRICMLLFSLAFFMFFLFLDGPKLDADSPAYLNYDSSIMSIPVYPLFIKIVGYIPFPLKGMCEGYEGVWQAVFFQNLLWGYVTYRVGIFVTDLLSVNPISSNQQHSDSEREIRRTAVVMGWGSMAFQFAVVLLNRFAAPRKVMYSNQILTEALAMPLFLLFIMALYRLAVTSDRKAYIRCAVLVFLLLGTRLQMKVTLLIWGTVAFVFLVILKNTRSIRRFVVNVALMVLIFTANVLFVHSVNYIKYGKWLDVPNPGVFFCNLLYTADDEDVQLFADEDPALRKCFEALHEQQKENDALLSTCAKEASLYEKMIHYALAYDVIGFNIAIPVIRESADENNIQTNEEWIQYFRETESKMVKVLFKQDLTKYAGVALMNIFGALVYSNARISPALMPISVILYIIYLILFVLLWRVCHKEHPGSMHNKTCACENTLRFAAIVMIAIAINSVSVGATIFPQGRYMIYCMGLFYSSLMLMIYVLFVDRSRFA